jgi:hypothetical protein
VCRVARSQSGGSFDENTKLSPGGRESKSDRRVEGRSAADRLSPSTV